MASGWRTLRRVRVAEADGERLEEGAAHDRVVRGDDAVLGVPGAQVLEHGHELFELG